MVVEGGGSTSNVVVSHLGELQFSATSTNDIHLSTMCRMFYPNHTSIHLIDHFWNLFLISTRSL